MLKTKCFIVGGIILSSSLQVKAFTPTNNTAACVAAAALAVNTANAANVANVANANKERERDNDKEPGIVTTAFAFFALLFFSILLFMCLVGIAGLFLEKDNGI
jgi:1,4-dihydroxy-2-naphthoate octaprenyltransferase